jgi:uncharacterized protein YqgC (DUF456 family)
MLKTKNGNLRNILGTILLLIGILGLIVPVVPGILLVVAGLVMLKSTTLKEYLLRMKNKEYFNQDKKK